MFPPSQSPSGGVRLFSDRKDMLVAPPILWERLPSIGENRDINSFRGVSCGVILRVEDVVSAVVLKRQTAVVESTKIVTVLWSELNKLTSRSR